MASKITHYLIHTNSMGDPGFPRRGSQSQRWAYYLIIFPRKLDESEKEKKRKELDRFNRLLLM